MLAPIDIGGGMVLSASDASSATSYVSNWRVDVTGANVPRPALSTLSVTGLGSYPIIGMYRFKDNLIVVDSNRYIYKISQGSPTVAISLSTSTSTTQLDGTDRPTFAQDDTDLFIAGGGSIQKWTPTSATTARLAGSSPSAVTHVVSIGQRIVANSRVDASSSNRYYWSDSGDASDSTWGALSFATAEARPDPIVALYENTSELFAFGESTIQVYEVGADPMLPFDLVSTLSIGTGANYSHIRADNSFYFVDDNRRIVGTDGRSYRPISGDIDSFLRSNTVSDAFGWRETTDKYDVLVWQFPAANRTFSYDLRHETWSEEKYQYNNTSVSIPVASYAYWPKFGYYVAGSSTAGALYRLDSTSFTDLGNPLLCERTTGWHEHGTPAYKRSSRLVLSMKRGTASEGATPGSLEVRVQNDDSDWTNWQQVSVGTPDQFGNSYPLFVGGVFRRRRYQFRYSNTDQTALVAAYDDVENLEAA